MTQPPPPYPGPGAAQATEFGAPTISGKPTTNGAAAPSAGATSETARVPVGPGAPGTPPPPLGSVPPNLVGAIPPPGPDAPKTGSNAPRVRGPRRARLQLRHINPWTVLRFSCVLSIALFFVWLIVVGILYGVLDASGVVNKVNDTVTTINGSGSKRPVTAGIVFGGAAIVGVINIVLFIALTTVGSIIYNLCADLVGGVELTLSEA
ncbi:MAG TPA: DUF3566 domain-containing protein [Jatrophihabitantaceae bacterium]|jgi:hypothetical protein|nr:DUF3566 domain-containing protein [Jatrophihabitantaceae bacterium]